MGGLTMSRFYLRLILIPIALFTLVLLIIRALPHDDHALRELLLPEGCPAPCFMGIRPGITTMDEAVALLEANSWVGHIEKEAYGPNNTVIWTWNDRVPGQIIPEGGGRIWIPQNSEQQLVDSITISSLSQLGELYALLGRPDTETLTFAGYSIGEEYAYIDYAALYDQEKLFLTREQACHTGYPGTGNSEIAGVPFTMPISIVMGNGFTLPISGQLIPGRSPIHLRRACKS